MSNTLTLTSLTENIFRAKDIIAREPTGFIQSVLVNSGSEGVSINGTVLSHVTAEPTLNTSYTPAMTIPAADDQTVTTESMTIGQVANVRVPLTGEALRQLGNTSGQKVIDDMMVQAIRKIVNTIESHCGSVIYKGSSRAVGTAGTTPFGSTIAILADLRQILEDNGTPMSDGELSTIISTSAGTKLRQIANLYKANEAGSDALLRRGELLNLMGLSIKASAGIASHTKGAGTGYDFSGSEAIGQTTLGFEGGTVNSTGIKAGDIIAMDTDTANNYVVKTGSTATSGDIVINNPGLRVAGTTASEITIGNSYTANLAFHRSAVELVMRPPAMPYGGDSATDRMTIVDDVTGLVFEVALYKGYGMNMLDFTCLYQAKVWKSEFVATLLG
jgi:hypothetical protein